MKDYNEGRAWTMNTYTAYWRQKPPKIVYAKTTLEAQQEAARAFGAKKAYEVAVVLKDAEVSVAMAS